METQKIMTILGGSSSAEGLPTPSKERGPMGQQENPRWKQNRNKYVNKQN